MKNPGRASRPKNNAAFCPAHPFLAIIAALIALVASSTSQAQEGEGTLAPSGIYGPGFGPMFAFTNYRTNESGRVQFLPRTQSTNPITLTVYGPAGATFTFQTVAPTPASAQDYLDRGYIQGGSDLARPDSDYLPVTNQFTMPAGGAMGVPLELIDDHIAEFNEDVLLQLRFNGELVDVATLTIEHDDPPAGAVDLTFTADPPYDESNPNPGANAPILAVAETFVPVGMENERRILIGGDFTAVSGTPRNRIARLMDNGDIDPAFNTGTGADDFVDEIALQADGKALVAGGFHSMNGISSRGLTRLNIDGSVDDSFRIGSGIEGVVRSISIVMEGPDTGDIYVAGDFGRVGGAERNHIARLNADGSLDVTFNPGPGPNGSIHAVRAQKNGKVVIGGSFTSVGGLPREGVARLHPNGAIDLDFDSAAGANGAVYSVELFQDDPETGPGGIMIGGAFSVVSGAGRDGVARLLSDGALDVSFDPGVGANDAVFDIHPLADGSAVIGGLFTSYNETSRTNLARLFPDGSLDTGFLDSAYNQRAGPTNASPIVRSHVSALAVQSDGAVVIGGAFTGVGGSAGRLGNGLGVGGRQFIGTDLGATWPATRLNSLNTPIDFALADLTVPVIMGGEVVMQPANLVRPSQTGGTGGTRWGLRSRSNIARLHGGSTANEWGEPGGPGNIGFASNTPSVNEGESTTLGITRANGRLGGAGVFVSTRDGSATSPQDYAAIVPPQVWRSGIELDGLMSFALGDNGPKSPTIATIEDATREGDEDFMFTFSRPASGVSLPPAGGPVTPTNIILGAALASPRTAAMTIIDDDFEPGEFQFSATDFTAVEGDGQATITVQRVNGFDKAVSVRYLTVAGGTAAEPDDYLGVENMLQFAPGQVELRFTVPLVDDTAPETDETILLQLTSPMGGAALGAPIAATLTLRDDDSGPGEFIFSVDSFTTFENAGTVDISVSRVAGREGEASVRIFTADGLSMAGVDYQALSKTLVFADGVVRQTAVIEILDDNVVSADGSVLLSLDSPTGGAGLGNRTMATLRIRENDSFGQLQFASDEFRGAETGGGASIVIERINGSSGTVSADLDLGGAPSDTATSGVDYASSVGSVVFGPGETMKSILLPITDDSIEEFEETATLALANLINADPGPRSSATLRIDSEDADPSQISFTLGKQFVPEGAGTAAIPVVRSGGLVARLEVGVRSVAGTAMAGPDEDFIELNQTVVFLPGEVEKTITLSIVDDNDIELNETLEVELYLLDPPVGDVTFTPEPRVVVSIIENDLAPGSLSFTTNRLDALEDAGVVLIPVARVMGHTGTVTVDYEAQNLTAQSGDDFAPLMGALVFADGELEKNIEVSILPDADFTETIESFRIQLSNPGGGAQLISQETITVRIIDVVPYVGSGGLISVGAELTSESMTPVNGSLDPDETVTVALELRNTGSMTAVNVVGDMAATEQVIPMSQARSFGSIAPGESASANFRFSAHGDMGDTIFVALDLSVDGGPGERLVFPLPMGERRTRSERSRIDAPANRTSLIGPAAPYPSEVQIWDLAGPITRITVVLFGLKHDFPDDLDILLVGPGGQSVKLMSDAGGSEPVDLTTLTFDDAAASPLPDIHEPMIVSGSYQPTDYDLKDSFPSPAPGGPHGSTLSVFNGLNPNGVWKLYVSDDESGDGGEILTGWSLKLESAVPIRRKLWSQPSGFTPDGKFFMRIIGRPGVRYTIEASSNLSDWEPVFSFDSVDTDATFLDELTQTLGRRFYRVREVLD